MVRDCEAPSPVSPLSILVVDDDAQLRSTVSEVLRRAGYAVSTESSGTAALAECARREIALVITDIIMPGMEGIEMIMKLRKLDPVPKVIAMSGGGRSGPEHYLPAAKALGARVTLRKPFRRQELLEAVDATLKAV